ncbi:shikimate kinase [Marvinbryantia formatexigens]|nr:shikimate kinase [Marvinbryantia formatexigens]UWO26549.1 shikimate kinase [Marvinbryantia formatexigens DSM 14469]SDF76458.1 shikimate kinase [Marvinbryantia formatexigens]
MENITLIGMPGAGKSTVGIVLAKVLGYDFIDSDLLIQKEEGKLLWQIMRDEGIAGFNQIEERVNSQINVTHSVIATGGSVIYGPKAMEHLRSISTVVYLKVNYRTLRRRLGDLNKRGVVLKPGQSLSDLYQERTPLYEQYAHRIVSVGGKNVQQSVEEIINALSDSSAVDTRGQ